MSAIVILGGLLILVQGLLDVAGITPLPAPDFVLPYVPIVGVVSIVAGLIVMFAGWLITTGKAFNGARLAVVFGIIGAAGGGGFFLGSILALIGGALKFRVEE